ncbi:uncharacterized protein [Rutidosis leptorrhynchoides]|uniref:uncharacterized protein n=1 Tax=Rutidosis leptorrhynchoides TaxID=125765 RepID=UPI003A993833
MEGLHLCLKVKVEEGLIKRACVNNSKIIVSHLFYADDAVIILDWNRDSLLNTLQVFNDFYRFSGLNINIAKSHLFGLGVQDAVLEDFVHEFSCSKGKFPLTYLGLPVGVNMNTTSSWKPLCDRFCKKLSGWKANMLAIGGRYTLLKSVLGSMDI